MKYYFYDEKGNVNLIYHEMPPVELQSKPHIQSDLVFEEKLNMITVYKVNIATNELYVEYVPRELTTNEKIEKLEKEVEEIKTTFRALLEVQTIPNFK